MGIPLSYYIYFWLRGSLLALFTGAFLVFLIPPLFAAFPYLAFLGLVIYQALIFRYFWGERKGDFEYKYKESTIESTLCKRIFDSFGIIKYIRFKLDNLNQIRNFQLYILQEILKRTDEDPNIKFVSYLKLAELYSTHNSYEKQKSALVDAVKTKKDSMVANLRLAVFLESLSEGESAIKQYELSLKDPEILSEQLKNFVQNQIERVKERGPAKRPPMPGLRYVTW